MVRAARLEVPSRGRAAASATGGGFRRVPRAPVARKTGGQSVGRRVRVLCSHDDEDAKRSGHGHVRKHSQPAVEARRRRRSELAVTVAEERIAIRPMVAEDAAALSDCFRRCYGESYVVADFYDPAATAARVRSGTLRSVVAVAESGEIVGHMG